MTRPGPRLVPALLAIAAAALLAPLVPPLAPLAGILALALLGAAAGETLYLRRVAVTAERPPVVALSLDDEDEIDVRIRTDAARPLEVVVRQAWPGLVGHGSASGRGRVRPGEVLPFTFRVRGVARGAEPLEPAWVAITAWGLAERCVAAGAPGELRVTPNLRAVRRLHDQLNQFALRGLGNRVSPRLGKGREFDRLRDYGHDDDFRDIAWKASARHNHLIVREFRIDRSQDVLVCIDRGHRMAARTTRITKVDHAVNAAVLVSYVCNRMDDRVGLLSFGADVERGVNQGRGPTHLRRLTAFATGVKPEFVHTDYLALAAHLRLRLRHRALLLLVTDLPEGDQRFALVRAVKMLLPQHLPVVLVVSDPDLQNVARILPSDHDELCRTLVARDVIFERQQTMKELSRLGALVVETSPDRLSLDGVNAYIDVKRRQLL